MNWQPIETAPKDGTQVLCAWQGADGWLYGVHLWRESLEWPGLYGWYFVATERFHKPTLWAPIETPRVPEPNDAEAPNSPTKDPQ